MQLQGSAGAVTGSVRFEEEATLRKGLMKTQGSAGAVTGSVRTNMAACSSGSGTQCGGYLNLAVSRISTASCPAW